jgi:hypothetical protein
VKHSFGSTLAMVAMLTVGLVLSTTPPSGATAAPLAYEVNYAVEVSGEPPFEAYCGTIEQACFERHGDRWWARDVENDGVARLEIKWENRLWNGSAWALYRQGSCITDLGYFQWGVCNKDYYESGSVNAYGYRGSSLRWQFCYAVCYGWGVWQDNNQ